MAAIRIENVTYAYPGQKQNALKRIDLEVSAGEFIVVSGPCLSGKTSLCLLATGLIPHFYKGVFQGEVKIFGRDTREMSPGEIAMMAGLVMQNPFSQLSGTGFTVAEEVARPLENQGIQPDIMKERIEVVLDHLGICDLMHRNPATLSGGQVQRVVIASILVMNTPLLILDEPASQLDPKGREDLFRLAAGIADQGKTVVMADRNIEKAAEYAHRLVIMDNGEKILDGPAKSIAASPLIEKHGLVPVRYTTAAVLAQKQGLWPENRPYPAILEDAVAGFRNENSNQCA